MGINEMDMRTLGLNSWLSENLDKDKLREYQLARVTAVDKESYIVKGEGKEVRAELTGKLMFSASSPLDYPTVGDWVYIQYFDDPRFNKEVQHLAYRSAGWYSGWIWENNTNR